jgi:uncharacterized protein (TIGR00251 family)
MTTPVPEAPTTVADLHVTTRNGAVTFAVHVRPRAPRAALVGIRNGALALTVTAPPDAGTANQHVLGLIARLLDVRRTDVAILVGPRSRDKVLAVTGIGPAELRARLARTLP